MRRILLASVAAFGLAGAVPVLANDSVATIDQAGDTLSATQDQSNGNSNTAYIKQRGNNQTASQVQRNGSNNQTYIDQSGSYHTANTTQDGNNNYFNVIQSNFNNRFDGTQTGT